MSVCSIAENQPTVNNGGVAGGGSVAVAVVVSDTLHMAPDI